jgi:2'-5' RNA ligase
MYEPKRLARCIFVPVSLANDQVSQFRRQFDSLEGKCPPHVTLVFPFVSDVLDSELTMVLEGSRPDGAFDVTLLPPQFDGGYVVLRVKQPDLWFERTHLKLSELVGARSIKAYRPHVTIGRSLTSAPTLAMATLPHRLQARIDRVILEEIQEDESSRVIHEVVFV